MKTVPEYPLPESRATIILAHAFTEAQMNAIQRGFTPREQQDKWRIIWRAPTLCFFRSWTGHCIFEADFRGHTLHCIRANRDASQYVNTDVQRDQATVLELIARHLPAG